MTEFLNAFWPNLASTMLGVAFGMPIAPYINRQLANQHRKLEAVQHKSPLFKSTNVLIDALQYNISVLDHIAELSRARPYGYVVSKNFQAR